MIDNPSLQLEFREAKRFAAVGAFADRIDDFATHWSAYWGLSDKPNCEVRLDSAPRMHVGLGVGTQLGLGVAAGLNRMTGRGECSPGELARSVDRGRRSAVGTFGFLRGGLIVEQGKLVDETLAPLLNRVLLPKSWRFVLITPRNKSGLHGGSERAAFAELPPVPLSVTEILVAEAAEAMLPAVAQGDFAQFSESVFRYGQIAGNCFASIQGGAYNGSHLENMVAKLRAVGLRGVGQSSWGPTLFALAASGQDAERVVRDVRAWPEAANSDILVAEPNNSGATICTDSSAGVLSH